MIKLKKKHTTVYLCRHFYQIMYDYFVQNNYSLKGEYTVIYVFYIFILVDKLE